MSCDHGYVDPNDCPQCPADREWDQIAALERIADALDRIAQALGNPQ